MYSKSDWKWLTNNSKVVDYEWLGGLTTRNSIRVWLDDGTSQIWSYQTKIMTITSDHHYIRHWGGYSRTTQKAVMEVVRIGAKLWRKMKIGVEYALINDMLVGPSENEIFLKSL